MALSRLGPPAAAARREALMLRAWALRLLAGAQEPPPSSGDEAWRLFTATERCALALRERMGKGPAGFEVWLDVELQRVLSARAMLRRLDRALSSRGMRGIALKGAVPLLEGRPALDLADVDILVRPGDVGALADALASDGLSEGKAAPEDLAVAAPGGWERAVRAAPGSVQVELHVALPFIGPLTPDPWSGARRTSFDSIYTPAPGVHLRHVLAHGAVHHPDRRGVLRELLLVQAALDSCSAEERAAITAELDGDPAGGVMQKAALAAAGLATGDPDRFRAEAALRYEMAERYRVGRRLRPWLWAAAFGLLKGGGEYASLWAGSARSAWGLGRGPAPVRFAWRAAQLVAVTPVAWYASRKARRAAAEP